MATFRFEVFISIKLLSGSMIGIPVAQLFLAGTLAIVVTELVKWVFGVTESDIGLHSSNNGKLIKARNATVIYAFLVLASNVVAFYAYEAISQKLSSVDILTTMMIDGIVMASTVVVIWFYLRLNHYSR